MSETETLFAALRQSADEKIVDMLERMVRDAPDHALNKMNALDLAGTQGIDEERVIATLLNAVGLGMFEMTWNVMCPSCAGVLSANKSLKTLDRAQYNCAFCAAGYETTLDNLVEVTFTVSPRLRKIAAHNPDELAAAEYYRQVFWSSGVDFDEKSFATLSNDVVLDALVRKTETIREQLGSVGQVIEERITKRLAGNGIGRGQGAAIAKAILEENDTERVSLALAEMDDEERARHERLLKEQDDLRRALERSRERVGVDPGDLQRVAAAALSRAGFSLEDARGESVGRVSTFRLDPRDPAFAKDAGWDDAFDDLRVRPRKRGERIGDWRRNAPIRAIAFEPPVLGDGRDATDVVQVSVFGPPTA
jgi:hypothetical protein